MGRLSLQDKKDANVFNVTIRNLTPKDAGIYICAVTVFKTLYITRVKLTVELSCVRYEITVTGYEGEDAVINCPYPKSNEAYPKYLLKGECNDVVEIIWSTHWKEWTHKKRVSLQNNTNRHILTVTIHSLTPKDAGIYRCGIDEQGTHFFTRVKLIVATQPLSHITEPERTTRFQSDPTSAASGDHLVPLSGGLVSAVVMFAVVVVAYRLMKSRVNRKQGPMCGLRNTAYISTCH
ncbi:high affinity immunoglobulin alpha and immunoglobulin mu Fc receptor-like [Sardina pilchardus]|uniref:high affinity immunoglobulin alpha and immunoglobulin mu Fc receptor-like n=1 Tax=Sardina pilchardus TaxID=27697 RepID=UPI002E10D400